MARTRERFTLEKRNIRVLVEVVERQLSLQQEEESRDQHALHQDEERRDQHSLHQDEERREQHSLQQDEERREQHSLQQDEERREQHSLQQDEEGRDQHSSQQDEETQYQQQSEAGDMFPVDDMQNAQGRNIVISQADLELIIENLKRLNSKALIDYSCRIIDEFKEPRGGPDEFKEPQLGDLPPEQSPVEQVALIVPPTDDPELPVWTFRSWTLGILSCILITFLNTFFSYRAEPIVITVTTALIGTSPLGNFMAAVLPARLLHIPFTPNSWSFSLNPGPFNVKEHTLITMFASAGGIRPGGIFVLNAVTIFFRRQFPMVAALLFVLTTELLAYSLAGIMQKFLVEPAEMWWPSSLVNVSIVRALHQEKKNKGMSQIQFFYMSLAISFTYYVLPGYLFPSLTSLSILCFAFPHNVLAQQLGSGMRGLGIGSFSFNWASIAAFLGSPLVAPWFAVANILGGFVLQTYLVVPFTYWRNIFQAKSFPLFSTGIYNSVGKDYDVHGILNSNEVKVDLTRMASQGLVYTSTFFAISCGFTFATFGAAVSHVFLFHGREIARRCRVAVGLTEKEPMDVHTRLMEAYPTVPLVWYIVLFAVSFTLAVFTLSKYHEQLQMTWWGLILALAIAATLLLPIGILVATTNQQPNLAIMSQYLMGLITPGKPIANVVFRTYSTVLCGRTIIYLSNFKLGHYMKVPPRATFIVQLIGTGIATFTSIVVSWWLKDSVEHICDLHKLPSTTLWTCPQDRVFYDQTVIWGLVGPQKMFGKDGPYKNLNWFFLLGFVSPVLVWLLSRIFSDRRWIRLVNMPLILQGAAPMPPAAVVNNSAWLTVSSFFSFFVFFRRRKWWQRYNYILSAALDAGTALMGVLLNYALDGKHLHWWGSGGNKCPLASCPTAPGIVVRGCPVV